LLDQALAQLETGHAFVVEVRRFGRLVELAGT
jgi:hypothetical protein